jgi:hypothetical protein
MMGAIENLRKDITVASIFDVRVVGIAEHDAG